MTVVWCGGGYGSGVVGVGEKVVVVVAAFATAAAEMATVAKICFSLIWFIHYSLVFLCSRVRETDRRET